MPYLKNDLREILRKDPTPFTAGQLNFLVTELVLKFLGDEPNYDRYNAAVGALECAKLELVRRSLSPYEDLKISESGDLPYPNRKNDVE